VLITVLPACLGLPTEYQVARCNANLGALRCGIGVTLLISASVAWAVSAEKVTLKRDVVG